MEVSSLLALPPIKSLSDVGLLLDFVDHAQLPETKIEKTAKSISLFWAPLPGQMGHVFTTTLRCGSQKSERLQDRLIEPVNLYKDKRYWLDFEQRSFKHIQLGTNEEEVTITKEVKKLDSQDHVKQYGFNVTCSDMRLRSKEDTFELMLRVEEGGRKILYGASKNFQLCSKFRNKRKVESGEPKVKKRKMEKSDKSLTKQALIKPETFNVTWLETHSQAKLVTEFGPAGNKNKTNRITNEKGVISFPFSEKKYVFQLPKSLNEMTVRLISSSFETYDIKKVEKEEKTHLYFKIRHADLSSVRSEKLTFELYNPKIHVQDSANVTYRTINVFNIFSKQRS